MINIVGIMKQLMGKESAIELGLENVNIGTGRIKIGLEGKVKLRLVHLRDTKSAKSK